MIYIGIGFIVCAFLATVSILLLLWHRIRLNNHPAYDFSKIESYIRINQSLIMTFVVASMALLFAGIALHRFDIAYIANYSSTKDELIYLISTFWAGQQGTFLLWIFYTLVFTMLIKKQKSEFEFHVLFVLHASNLLILMILLNQNPFRPLDPAILENLEDGRGLNPLLKNPWMIAHPPILFLGYTSVIVSSAFAIAGLWKRKVTEWMTDAFPWTLFSTSFLGLGIIMGGYWAYVVLGWGGYWAWDPVENASAFPWFTIVACFHAILIFRAVKAFAKTAIFLALISYMLMLYGSFLTRSGVLGDFSVHSFSSLGINHLLVAFMLIYFLAISYLMISRWKLIPFQRLEDKFSKEMILAFVVILFTLSIFAILIGTSIPLVTLLAEKQTAAAQPEQYNYVFSHVVIFFMLFLGLAPIQRWKQDGFTISKMMIIQMLAIAIAVMIIVFISKDNMPLNYYVVYATATWAFCINIFNFIKNRKSKFLRYSALSHIGMAMMILGIMASSTLGTDARISLVQNKLQEYEGMDLTYKRKFTDERNNLATFYEVAVNDKERNEIYSALLVFEFSEYNNGTMRKPHVERHLSGDVYYSPVNQYEYFMGKKRSMGKNDTIHFASNILKFEGFKVIEMNPQNTRFIIEGLFEISQADKTEKVTALFEQIRGTSDGKVVELNHFDFQLKIINVNANERTVDLIVSNLNNPLTTEQLDLEISEKPFIVILWLGTIILFLGSLLASRERFRSLQVKEN